MSMCVDLNFFNLFIPMFFWSSSDHIRLVDPTERKVLQKKFGDPVNMTCVFESNRCFQGIMWWTPKADLPIEQTSGSFEIVTNLCQPKGNSTFSESILTIAEVTANMSGGFTCMAYDNEAPCSHNSTALFELKLPFIPEGEHQHFFLFLTSFRIS